MDTDAPAPIDIAVCGEGQYLRRAQTLLAARGDLFLAGPARSMAFAEVAANRQDRATSAIRRASRQLSLPLPRERKRPRARMVR
jgi:hypothetical protein